jgi:archaellum biogenesis ATPase FlaH
LASLSPGNRNETFTRVTGKLHHYGFDAEEIKALLQPHAEKCQFPLSELSRLIGGICSRYPSSDPISNFPPIYRGKSGTGSQELQIKTLNEFLNEEQPDMIWAVDNLFPIESINFIAGPAGHGKSWMLQDLAIAIATGSEWLGHFGTSHGSVLYIDEESSRSLLRGRFDAPLRASGKEQDLSNIQICVGQEVNFTDSDTVKRLLRAVNFYKPSVIIIDCLIRVHSAEENSASEMSRVFGIVKSIVRQFGCAFVIADHHRKPGRNSTRQDISLRGSTDKMAVADSVLSIQSKDNKITVEHTKSRHSQAIKAFIVEIEDLDEDSTTVRYVGEAERNDRSSKLTKAQQFIEKELECEEWISRRVLIEFADEEGISPKVLDKALKQLVADERMEREDRPPESGRGGKSAFYRKKEK